MSALDAHYHEDDDPPETDSFDMQDEPDHHSDTDTLSLSGTSETVSAKNPVAFSFDR